MNTIKRIHTAVVYTVKVSVIVAVSTERNTHMQMLHFNLILDVCYVMLSSILGDKILGPMGLNTLQID